jgi:hypothetical protein
LCAVSFSAARQYDVNAAFDMALGWHLTGTLRNDFTEHPRSQDSVEMLIDSGMIGVDMDLILPYSSVRGLGLKATKETTTPGTFGGHGATLTKFQPVHVAVPLFDPVKRDQVVETKEAYLDVWADTAEHAVIRLENPTGDGRTYLKPHQREPNTPMYTAILGKQGLAKFSLRLDPKKHYVFPITKTSRV